MAREVICTADTDLGILVVFVILYELIMKEKKKQDLHKPRGIGIYFNIKGGGGLRKEDIVASCSHYVFGKVSVDVSPLTA